MTDSEANYQDSRITRLLAECERLRAESRLREEAVALLRKVSMGGSCEENDADVAFQKRIDAWLVGYDAALAGAPIPTAHPVMVYDPQHGYAPVVDSVACVDRAVQWMADHTAAPAPAEGCDNTREECKRLRAALREARGYVEHWTDERDDCGATSLGPAGACGGCHACLEATYPSRDVLARIDDALAGASATSIPSTMEILEGIVGPGPAVTREPELAEDRTRPPKDYGVYMRADGAWVAGFNGSMYDTEAAALAAMWEHYDRRNPPAPRGYGVWPELGGKRWHAGVYVRDDLQAVFCTCDTRLDAITACNEHRARVLAAAPAESATREQVEREIADDCNAQYNAVWSRYVLPGHKPIGYDEGWCDALDVFEQRIRSGAYRADKGSKGKL